MVGKLEYFLVEIGHFPTLGDELYNNGCPIPQLMWRQSHIFDIGTMWRFHEFFDVLGVGLEFETNLDMSDKNIEVVEVMFENLKVSKTNKLKYFAKN